MRAMNFGGPPAPPAIAPFGPVFRLMGCSQVCVGRNDVSLSLNGSCIGASLFPPPAFFNYSPDGQRTFRIRTAPHHSSAPFHTFPSVSLFLALLWFSPETRGLKNSEAASLRPVSSRGKGGSFLGWSLPLLPPPPLPNLRCRYSGFRSRSHPSGSVYFPQSFYAT